MRLPGCPRPQALGLRPEDAFTAEMLAEAMEEASARFEARLRAEAAGGGAQAPGGGGGMGLGGLGGPGVPGVTV